MNTFIIVISFNIGISLYRKTASTYKCTRNLGHWSTLCGAVMAATWAWRWLPHHWLLPGEGRSGRQNMAANQQNTNQDNQTQNWKPLWRTQIWDPRPSREQGGHWWAFPGHWALLLQGGHRSVEHSETVLYIDINQKKGFNSLKLCVNDMLSFNSDWRSQDHQTHWTSDNYRGTGCWVHMSNLGHAQT